MIPPKELQTVHPCIMLRAVKFHCSLKFCSQINHSAPVDAWSCYLNTNQEDVRSSGRINIEDDSDILPQTFGNQLLVHTALQLRMPQSKFLPPSEPLILNKHSLARWELRRNSSLIKRILRPNSLTSLHKFLVDSFSSLLTPKLTGIPAELIQVWDC
jgi:hypothetical protein